MEKELKYKNRVVIVTGAGQGLGKQYALFFASRGAKIIVNDLGTALSGEKLQNRPADIVVNEIKSNGGQAVANYDSVEFGEKIVKTAMDNYGRIDILINNAGILRDISFQKMTHNDFDIILAVHLKGTYSVCKAAWNIMKTQNYGRIINTTSASGLYGAFGQANYSAAKLGILGLTLTLAKEGEKNNILCNAIAPVAASRMTETAIPKSFLQNIKPEYVVPLVAYLANDQCSENGQVFEVGGGFISKVRWQRSQGSFFDLPFTPEQVRDKFAEICNFSKENEYPNSAVDALRRIGENMDRIKAQPKVEQKIAEKSQPQQIQNVQQEQSSQKQSVQLKTDKIFDIMSVFLERGEGQEAVSECNALYNFQLTQEKGGKVIKCWVIDLKNGKGKVYEGELKNADTTFIMTDDDFYEVCLGNLNPQNAFLSGKMKINGNLKKGAIFTPELFPAPTPENFEKYSRAQTKLPEQKQVQKQENAVVLKTDKIFQIMGNFLAKGEGAEAIKECQAVYNFFITKEKNGPIMKSWIIDLKNGKGKVCMGKDEKADSSFTMTDDDFELVSKGELNAQNAFLQGKMKIAGNMKKATIFTPELFPAPTPENFKIYGDNAEENKDATQAAETSVALKTDRIFELMNSVLLMGEGQEALTCEAVYNFHITLEKGGKIVKYWIIDLKNPPGRVYQGESKNADSTFTMTDSDFEQVCMGNLNPQNAFLQGKMKISGNMRKATIFTPELFPTPTPENFAKYSKPKL